MFIFLIYGLIKFSFRRLMLCISHMLYFYGIYIEENKYFPAISCYNTLLFCKFSHLEITEGSEIVIVGACPL